MTLLAPQFLYAALGVAGAIVALHFLVSRQPRAGVLPTARFIPDVPAAAASRFSTPTDLALLLLRVLLVSSAGLGLARPVPTPARRAESRVILADVSRSVRDMAALRDTVTRLHRDGDAVIVFDSAARLLDGRVADTLRALAPSSSAGRLSAAFVAALRAASTLASSVDSLELVIVSPLAAEEHDAATASIRTLWPGRATIVRVGGAARDTVVATPPLAMRDGPGMASDPLAVAMSLLWEDEGASALIVRDASPGAAPAARALVHWPAEGRPRGATPRERSDTIGGVVADGRLVVAPFARRWRYSRDSLADAHVVARWTDGEPAAVEWANGSACVRSVAIPVPAAGDLVIRHDFLALVAALGRPCRGAQRMDSMAPSVVASLAGAGGRAPRGAFRPRLDEHSSLGPWLLGLAIVLAVVELFVRERRTA